MQAPKADVFVIGSGIDIIVLLANITFASIIINLVVVTYHLVDVNEMISLFA